MRLMAAQRGDTILEVLISVAVLSLVMASSFALATRSTQTNRQAAERGEAQKIAQAEMEKLKLYLSTPGAVLPTQGSYFCMNDLATGTVALSGIGLPSDPNADLTFSSPLYSNPSCKSGDFYYHFIQRGTGSDQKNTYTSSVRWPSPNGKLVNQSAMTHRVYPDLTSVIIP